MNFRNHRTNLKNPCDIRSFFGVSTGCFTGTGYGFMIGFGRQFYPRSGLCIVYPSRNPFAHSGCFNGCYCGIAIGFWFGSGITGEFGIEKRFKNPIQKIIRILKRNSERLIQNKFLFYNLISQNGSTHE